MKYSYVFISLLFTVNCLTIIRPSNSKIVFSVNAPTHAEIIQSGKLITESDSDSKGIVKLIFPKVSNTILVLKSQGMFTEYYMLVPEHSNKLMWVSFFLNLVTNLGFGFVFDLQNDAFLNINKPVNIVFEKIK